MGPLLAQLLALGAAGGDRGDDEALVVTFDRYAPQHDHAAWLEASGVPHRTVTRRNAATASFPTDFLLVALDDAEDAAALRRLPRVRAVRHQWRYGRSLQASGGAEPRRLSTAFARAANTSAAEWLRGNTSREAAPPEAEAAAGDDGSGGHRAGVGEGGTAGRVGAPALWERGHRGGGVRVAIFDTGLDGGHPDFVGQLEGRTDWTSDGELGDTVGHGTFVAGVLGGRSEACPGIAPDAELYTFRVFNSQQQSYTSWFLDAFNFALFTDMNVLNLSIGGPDTLDQPFVQKVRELSANNVIVVSAIGNDGPDWGTLNSPAEQSDVIGVTGVDRDGKVAPFSSRGMSTQELPFGYGRVGVDLAAPAVDLHASHLGGACTTMTGTSVASPVVAGAVALLASVVPAARRWEIVNPASMKQVLLEGAEPTGSAGGMFEEGSGLLSLERSSAAMASYTPHASIHPSAIDLTDCPALWPWCTQPLFHTASAVTMNLTVLNGVAVHGTIDAVHFEPDENGHLLQVSTEHSPVLWPWTGWLALSISVIEAAREWQGIAEGRLVVRVRSDVGPRSSAGGQNGTSDSSEGVRVEDVVLPVRVGIIPQPPRSMRLLFDVFHSIQYPPGFIPRDGPAGSGPPSNSLDWHGDHLHTNHRSLYNHLRGHGYFVDILRGDFACFDARHYSALLLVDAEEDFSAHEVEKLERDVMGGLSLIVFADWHDQAAFTSLRFRDENTRRWWSPAVGGANVPALNELLRPYGIAFGPGRLTGSFQLDDQTTHFANGVPLTRFPAGGRVAYAWLREAAGADAEPPERVEAPVFGIAAVEGASSYLAAFGDSGCVEDRLSNGLCLFLIDRILGVIRARGGKIAESGAADDGLAGLGEPVPTALAIGHDEPDSFYRRTDAFRDVSKRWARDASGGWVFLKSCCKGSDDDAQLTQPANASRTPSAACRNAHARLMARPSHVRSPSVPPEEPTSSGGSTRLLTLPVIGLAWVVIRRQLGRGQRLPLRM